MGMQRGLCPLAKKVRCHTPAHILRNVSSSTFCQTTVAATIDREDGSKNSQGLMSSDTEHVSFLEALNQPKCSEKAAKYTMQKNSQHGTIFPI